MGIITSQGSVTLRASIATEQDEDLQVWRIWGSNKFHSMEIRVGREYLEKRRLKPVRLS